MAIKLSTAQRIQAVMAGHDDWACVSSYYNPWWKTACICGHGIKEVYVIGHVNDHGPAFSLPTFNLGSECFKFLAQDPRFQELSETLQSRRLEIARIQRAMKRERENAFHASAEWRKIQVILCDVNDIFWSVRQDASAFNHLRRMDVVLSSRLSWDIKSMHTKLQSVNRGDLRFQDLESAQEFANGCVTLVTSILEELRSHAEKIQACVSAGFEGKPGWGGFKSILDKLQLIENRMLTSSDPRA